MTRIRLLTRYQDNNGLHEAGDVVTLAPGQRGPHRTAVAASPGTQITANRYTGDAEPDASYARQDIFDEPLFVILDEGVEREREEMLARHAEERAKLDRYPERDELAAKHAREQADMAIRTQEAELKGRQKREHDALKARQDGEAKAFEKRADAAPATLAPIESDKGALDERHRAEIESQQARHDAEQTAIDERKAQRHAQDSEPEPVDDAPRTEDERPLMLTPPPAPPQTRANA